MRRELPYFRIGSAYGGRQDWFHGLTMRLGGCAAAAACDCCLYFDLYFGSRLYPFDLEHLTAPDYAAFGEEMKPFLRPRLGGISRLKLFIDGFSDYLESQREDRLRMTPFFGEAPFHSARRELIRQLDLGYPIPFLCLHHKSPAMKHYDWHWFLLTGYDVREGSTRVKAVTYGGAQWIDFHKLWESGFPRKGGMILLSFDR